MTLDEAVKESVLDVEKWLAFMNSQVEEDRQTNWAITCVALWQRYEQKPDPKTLNALLTAALVLLHEERNAKARNN